MNVDQNEGQNKAQRALRFLDGTGKQYKPSLNSLTSFIAGEPFACNYIYSDAELCAIQPKHVPRWMNFRTFGTIIPAVDANPIGARLSSLQNLKKAISFFHTDVLLVWSTGNNEGNPTRSIKINHLIKRVKRKEVRKQGVLSQTQRAITEVQFRSLHTEFRDVSSSMLRQYGMSTLITFQFHLIERIDVTATQVLIDHLCGHDSFLNCLKTKLNWSKNVGDERDSQWIIILGSMDTTYCALVSLAIWKEMNMHANASAGASPHVFLFTDDVDGPSGGQKANILRKLFLVRKSSRWKSLLGMPMTMGA